MPGKLQDYRITSHECLEAMLFSALRMVQEIGIETSRQDLLERAKGLAGISVNGNRIHIAPEVANEVIQENQFSEETPLASPVHPTITVSDYANLFADHRARVLRPLTRSDAIAGTKLWTHSPHAG